MFLVEIGTMDHESGLDIRTSRRLAEIIQYLLGIILAPDY